MSAAGQGADKEGLLHIYCGDGKGKTTAALGLALRAAGSGMRVHIVQFLKGAPTSELVSLCRIPEISLERCDRNYGFTFSMSQKDKAELTACHNRMLKHAAFLAQSGQIDLLILDEFNAAYGGGYLDREAAKELVLNRPEGLELVLTGREPDPVFTEAADYISCIEAVRHPYQKGISARKGIEF
ncbi:MAG: cob(I)yrinic acid a,c-diamide adenosyltransferase [Eubacteriales bacterium]|nr:cob(I)yrinic acid a,c-diamide adenosyltransferase [Eubacteriales bacterium]